MSESPSDNRAGGLLSRLAGSAEFAIAGALIVVCVAVGGALWWLQPRPEALVQATPAASATPARDDTVAADNWQRRLDEQFDAIDEQQQRRVAEEEAAAQRERQRADERAADARRQNERTTAMQREAEAALQAKAAAPRPTSAPTVSIVPPKPPTPAPAAVALPTGAPVRLEAAIDWSSCSAPAYPALSVKRGEEGLVVIVVELDARARILDSRVSRSSGHSRLDRVTLEAVQKCQFTPATENGMPRPATAEVRFTWKLQG